MNGVSGSRSRSILLGLLVLGLVDLTACGDPPRGVGIAGQRVAVIDMHIHTGEWSSVRPMAKETIANNLPFPFNTDPEGVANQVLSTEGITDEIDAAGISEAGLFAVYAPRSTGVASNELVASRVAEAPDRFHGFASLRIEDWDAEEADELARLDRALDNPGMTEALNVLPSSGGASTIGTIGV